MKKRIKDKRALLVDMSGFDPINYLVSTKKLSPTLIENFFQGADIDLFYSQESIKELGFCFNSQGSLAEIGLSEYKTIYLSDSGNFSQSTFYGNELPLLATSLPEANKQLSLWQISGHWQYLDTNDKHIIETAHNLEQNYDSVAILTNDWHLKRQAIQYEAIPAYGTCSLLAAIAIENAVSYQKATSIFTQWRERNPKWIPRSEKFFKKMEFREILAIERQRKKDGKSFWIT